MSTSQSFLCYGLFELWNPNRVSLENAKTKQTSYFYTYDSEPAGSVAHQANTIVIAFGRAAISKEDGETILIEAIKILPFGGDPNAEYYGQNIPEMAL
ncbi:hypothetical protein FRC00_008462 [Tulasnella sp. 408]|nr:hypothetical protein FRC00_008462 [Tulasnella sp. 408]